MPPAKRGKRASSRTPLMGVSLPLRTVRAHLQSTQAQSCPRGRAGVACDERTTDTVGNLGGVNYLGRRIDSSELLPVLTCCLT